MTSGPESQGNDFPKVSVIIPLYNREDFIAQAVQSVLDQTYKNIELIVVDDGSTDSSREVLKKFGGKIRILEHLGHVNKGQSAAINLGLRFSEGKYVAILDSDDLFAPEKIQFQIEFLGKNPDIGVVYTNGQAINEEGKFLYQIYDRSHNVPEGPEAVLLSSWFNVPSNALVERSVFDEVGEFDESMRSAQDHDMAVRLAETTKIGFLPEVLWSYRKHAVSQSGMHAARRWKIGFKILEKAKKRYPYASSVIRKRRAVLHFRLGQCYVEEKKYIKSLFHFLLSGLLDPVRALYVVSGREVRTGPH